MKLRYKYILVLFFMTTTIAICITSILAFSFSEHKKESIYETNTTNALNISENISQYFKYLKLAIDEKDNGIILKFPEINAVSSPFDIIDIRSSAHFIDYTKVDKNKEVQMVDDFLIWKYKGVFVKFNSDFLNRFTKINSRAQFSLYNISQNQIIPFEKEAKLTTPPSELLTKILNQKNQAVVASFDSRQGDTFTALAAITHLNNSILILQTSQQDIGILVKNAIKNSALPLISLYFIIILIGIFSAQRITKPLENLIKATKKLAQGNWDLNLNQTTQDEIGTLTNSFSQLGEDLKQREEKINDMNLKLLQSEKLASLGMFSAGIAHEVKNPLGAILGNAQLIKRKTDPENKDVHKYSDVIIRESYRATDIIEDLLVFAKERPLNIESHNADEFFKELRNTIEPKLVEENISLTLNNEINSLNCDYDQMFQVLQNIIFNAADALLEIETNKSIQILSKSDEKSHYISVIDNGPGIAQENLSKVFEPFFSTKRIKKGTGLGMAICYGIVQKHLGEIKVESKLNQETNFTIILPK